MNGPGPIILAAGGTGGHVFPAEALARALLARGREVVIITDRRGQGFGQKNLGERLPGVPVLRIRAGRFDGGIGAKLLGAGELLIGIAEALRHLRKLRPAAVVGFGGYPSVPAVLAGALLRLPTLIHEQNAVLGRANRLLAPFVGKIAVGFPGKGVHTGNPVRPEIAALRAQPYRAPEAKDRFELLILGGSQGARIFSDVVPEALTLLPDSLKTRLRVAQQARPEDLERVRAAYAASGIEAELAPFFADVPVRLARAHLVIARAGASTVAELTVAGRPSILVPYPFATDDHQTANAGALAKAGAALLVAQPEFTAAALAERLEGFTPSRLGEIAESARAFGMPDAAERLSDLVLTISEAS